MRYSRKEYCELCGYRFSFTPIYSPDMPRRLPLRDVIGGLFSNIVTAVKYWLHYTLVAIAWLGVVPLTACRTYRALFSGPLDLVRVNIGFSILLLFCSHRRIEIDEKADSFYLQIMSLPMDMLSAENISSDVFHGCFVVTCTLFAFIGLVWLREQILHAGGPDWLERDNVQLPPVDNPPPNIEPPVQQLREQGALQQQEIQDNNNVPPFVDEPVILPEHSNNDDLENADEHRAEENNVPDNPRIDEREEIGRDAEPQVAARNADEPIEPPARDLEPLIVPQDMEPLIPLRDIEQLAPPRNELDIDGEQANARVGEGWRDQAQGQAQGEAEEANWNPLEWDRPAEELTWERLLGLDGSLVFLEHVFWVVSLNTLFIMVIISI